MQLCPYRTTLAVFPTPAFAINRRISDSAVSIFPADLLSRMTALQSLWVWCVPRMPEGDVRRPRLLIPRVFVVGVSRIRNDGVQTCRRSFVPQVAIHFASFPLIIWNKLKRVRRVWRWLYKFRLILYVQYSMCLYWRQFYSGLGQAYVHHMIVVESRCWVEWSNGFLWMSFNAYAPNLRRQLVCIVRRWTGQQVRVCWAEKMKILFFSYY